MALASTVISVSQTRLNKRALQIELDRRETEAEPVFEFQDWYRVRPTKEANWGSLMGLFEGRIVFKGPQQELSLVAVRLDDDQFSYTDNDGQPLNPERRTHILTFQDGWKRHQDRLVTIAGRTYQFQVNAQRHLMPGREPVVRVRLTIMCYADERSWNVPVVLSLPPDNAYYGPPPTGDKVGLPSQAELSSLLRDAIGGDADAMFALAQALEKGGREGEAGQWLRRAADQGQPGAMNKLGVLLNATGDHEAAERLYRQAAEQEHLAATTNLGLLLLRAGNAAEAEAWLTKATQGGEPIAQRELIRLLVSQGRTEDARRWQPSAAEASPPSDETGDSGPDQ
ncbi:tetratricopeptide repeat protein [Hamadaea tsunoensis]|uniref:tetratricopeptide repeat protein n=1 Tax=Hamadaea tsunoensis TaxID=53368 RepID=UPI0012FC3189|nr:tetratricopeptide repeat protein [Hamadaea tsunoensis]